MAEVKNARLTMEWPPELKERVRAKVGPRGLTEYTIEAVEVALNGGADHIKRVEIELNQTKDLVQLLADRLAMGGSAADRVSAMMELELPSWIDTTGWPSEYAKLVQVDILDEPVPYVPVETGPTDDVGGASAGPATPSVEAPKPEMVEAPALTQLAGHFGVEGTVKVPKGEPLDTRTAVVEPPPLDLPVSTSKDDLFARIMAKTDGKMQDFEGLKDLKVASEIAKPEPKAEPTVEEIAAAYDVPADQIDTVDEDARDLITPAAAQDPTRCAECGDELVDGECWTC